MQSTSRRVFMLKVATGTSLLAGTTGVAFGEAEKLLETDSYAKSMGFRYDTTKVDQARYPRHDAATQQCAKCQLFTGKITDEWGICSFFGDRMVKPTGWCRNFKALKAA